MNSHSSPAGHRYSASLAGIFYILATVTSIVAFVLYGPLLQHTDHISADTVESRQIGLAAIIDCFSIVTVAGTAIMLFPYLRKYNESLALGYLSLRILEAVAIMVSIISALSLLSTTQYQTTSVHSDMTGYYVVTTSLLAVHDWAYIVGPNFLLGINTLIYSYIFLRSELVPKTLATWRQTLCFY